MRVHALYKRQVWIARALLAVSLALWIIGVVLLVDLYRVSGFL